MLRLADALLVLYVRPLWWWWQAAIGIHNAIWRDNLSFDQPRSKTAAASGRLWALVFMPGLLAYIIVPLELIRIFTPDQYDAAILLGGGCLFTLTMMYGVARRRVLRKQFPARSR